ISVQRSEEAPVAFCTSPDRILGAPEPCFAGQTFEEFFFAHYPRLVKTLARLTGNPAQAEELAADAFCKLYRRGPGSGGENLAGWLYRTAINLGLDALRANSRRLRREEQAVRQASLSERPASPLHELMAREDRDRVRKVMSQMK